jgi:outer membrane protein OmpA-like peptidoglycan-associated protein
MEKGAKIVFCLITGFLLVYTSALGQEDEKGCKDHPFFSRMPNYYIAECSSSPFDSFEFYDPDSQGKKAVTVEGKKFMIRYYIKDAFSDKQATELQISNNYANAVKKMGGTAYIDRCYTYTKYKKGNSETWGYIFVNENGRGISITLIEKGEMKQDVVADAKSMANDISTSGKVAIYGIYFDFNKADVKPESDPTLKEITKLLSQDPKLKLYVVGHTDNLGGLDYNMKLSQQRAEAVVKELVSKYKVDGSRLKALGVGPAAPVTSNDTEEGKAKNRRVELVKQ